MIGETIKKLRQENELTQKELAEKLFVTAQAVSRWENNEVEPSLATLTEMSKVFNVTIGELLGEEKPTVEAKEEVKLVAEKSEVKQEKEVVIQQPKPVLAVCEKCNKPIYNASEIVRETKHYGDTTEKVVYCIDCDRNIREARRQACIEDSAEKRKKSYIWGSVISVAIIIFAIIGMVTAKQSTLYIVLAGLGGALFFPFISCLFLDNNYIEEIFGAIASWSIRFPGLIFTLDLDGILWVISVKILFGIISFFISVFCFFLALVVSLVFSVFVYPFALVKSIKHPELTGEI